jgi:hypothetical protein
MFNFHTAALVGGWHRHFTVFSVISVKKICNFNRLTENLQPRFFGCKLKNDCKTLALSILKTYCNLLQ